jgi:hypothetical protein
MGLDQYASTVSKRGQKLREQMLQLPSNQERKAFWEENRGEDEVDTIQTWRKHANLNEWMTQLAVRKGVVKNAIEFNCVDLLLNADDIADLEATVLADEMPVGGGFFWGKSFPEDKQLDLDFIEKAKRAMDAGQQVIYSCWW